MFLLFSTKYLGPCKFTF